MTCDDSITINGRRISADAPTYFIADIAANHDGDLERAKSLIWLAKKSGADAVKFQHFQAAKIVSDMGFRSLGAKIDHQASWKKTVFEIYKDYEVSSDWNAELIATAQKANIEFFTTPYDFDVVTQLDHLMPAYKIGSGDITWIEFITFVAGHGKPMLIATGAASQADVDRAVAATLRVNKQLVLMQCNTNYSGSVENFRYINLRVLNTFRLLYPGIILGLSDHSRGHTTVLGAIALGARVIEKHFTDDNSRSGPDHAFSMEPDSWLEMVQRSRELELALGDGIKRVEPNESNTVVVQQRALYATRDLRKGDLIGRADLEALRPAPNGGVRPYQLDLVVGQKVKVDLKKGQMITSDHWEESC
jgi:sialic acid synthase SpsE